MALLGGSAIGIDLGSERTRICLNGGVALSEPTAVLVSSANAQEVLAVGMEAAALSGRAAGQAELLSPVVAGAVADVDMAALLVVALTEKAAGRKKMFDKATLIAPAHGGLTRVERQAARSALAMTGARRIATVRESMAGALGAGLDAAAPKGQLILLLGGGVAEVAVISMHAVVAERAMRLGGQSLNQAIIDWFLREKGVLIGPRVAEQLKLDLGTEQRNVFSGIAAFYKPEDLVGRHVVMIANLAPRKMRLGVSEGMVLCASDKSGDGQGVFVLTVDEGVKPGMKVS